MDLFTGVRTGIKIRGAYKKNGMGRPATEGESPVSER